MPNKITHLKIKIGSLVAEAKLIKAEEQKWRVTEPKRVEYTDHRNIKRVKVIRIPKKRVAAIPKHERPTDHPMRDSLYRHRIDVVRPEIRAALLAYGFLRGRSYEEIEAEGGSYPDVNRVWEIANNFRGDRDYRDVAQKFEEWCQEGEIPTRDDSEESYDTNDDTFDTPEDRSLVGRVFEYFLGW